LIEAILVAQGRHGTLLSQCEALFKDYATVIFKRTFQNFNLNAFVPGHLFPPGSKSIEVQGEVHD
jgi:hypothetical protein